MALILFGTSGAGQIYRVGANGGAASTLVTADATASEEVFSNPARAYLMRIPMQQTTGVLAANAIMWGMHNGNSLTMRIKRITATVSFSGVVGATTSNFQFIRWSAPSGTNLTGGTAIAPVRRTSSMLVSTFADARFNVGAALGVAGITFELEPFLEIGVQRQPSPTALINISKEGGAQYDSIVSLAPNEGIAIRVGVATVLGDAIGGGIEWTEV